MDRSTKLNLILIVVLVLFFTAGGGAGGYALAQSKCQEQTVEIKTDPCECVCECVIASGCPEVVVPPCNPCPEPECPEVNIVPAARHFIGPGLGDTGDGWLAGWGYSYVKPRWMLNIDAGVHRYQEERLGDYRTWTPRLVREDDTGAFVYASWRWAL